MQSNLTSVAPIAIVSDVAPIAPATVETAKPVKAAKPSKPKADKPAAPKAAPAPAAVSADDEAKRIEALRALASKYYNGASIAAHQRKPAKRDDYAARITSPVQKIGPSGPSTRDESGLALILSGANKAGAFDPCKLNLDLGIASRLASVGMLAFDKASDTFSLTKSGRERANLVIKRAA